MQRKGKRAFLLLLLVAGVLSGCQGSRQEEAVEKTAEKTEILVFIAASLHTVMTQLATEYEEAHPEVSILFQADSSGTLMTQIEEGYACDLFFSAAQKQMDELEEKGFLVEGSRTSLLHNRVIVVSRKGSQTKVTGLKDLGKAESIALAGGSVPVGKYTRQALVELGILSKTEDVAAITTQEITEALGGVEISEQDNVSKVLTAVLEGSCEVGTVYYSDLYGYEEELEILEMVDKELTGEVIYPVSRVVNTEADAAQTAAAEDFLRFLQSEEAKAVFEAYYFDTEIEG